MMTRSDILRRIKKSIIATDPQATIVLYGSMARGDYNESSDIDILILLNQDNVTWADEKRVAFPLYDIEFDTGTIISPLVLSKSEWETRHRITPFYNNVVKEGKVL
jgi:uncharacterized protein